MIKLGMQNNQFKALDFFAGSGLVTDGLKRSFTTVWANDICPKKKRVYTENFGDESFELSPIQKINGKDLPYADLAWASFPCQDLSLAGKMSGIMHGKRSALYWEWIRVIGEMSEDCRPHVFCIENVVGFLVADSGKQFKLAYDALKEMGYKAGAFVLDAAHFVPQSRPRSFIIAVKTDVDISGLCYFGPNSDIHNKSVIRAFNAVNDPEWVWWDLPRLPKRKISFSDICERDAPCNPMEKNHKLLGMLSDRNQDKLAAALKNGKFIAGTGYKRVRKSEGQKTQRFEIRFDGMAGCLRTPCGGSSRQSVIIVENGSVKTRLLTIREAAKLMGVDDEFKLPDSYNDAYMALGDAVAVPVTRFIADNLLAPLCKRAIQQNKTSAKDYEMKEFLYA